MASLPNNRAVRLSRCSLRKLLTFVKQRIEIDALQVIEDSGRNPFGRLVLDSNCIGSAGDAL